MSLTLWLTVNYIGYYCCSERITIVATGYENDFSFKSVCLHLHLDDSSANSDRLMGVGNCYPDRL